MSLLVILTLVYVGILVLALAASLIAIWIFLERIGSELKKVHAALDSVEEKTRPLATPLQLLQDVSHGTAQDLAQAQDELVRAEDRLAALGGPAR